MVTSPQLLDGLQGQPVAVDAAAVDRALHTGSTCETVPRAVGLETCTSYTGNLTCVMALRSGPATVVYPAGLISAASKSRSWASYSALTTSPSMFEWNISTSMPQALGVAPDLLIYFVQRGRAEDFHLRLAPHIHSRALNHQNLAHLSRSTKNSPSQRERVRVRVFPYSAPGPVYCGPPATGSLGTSLT